MTTVSQRHSQTVRQTDERIDGQTTYHSNTAMHIVHRAVKVDSNTSQTQFIKKEMAARGLNKQTYTYKL